MAKTSDCPNVLMIPPMIVVGFLVLGYLLDLALPAAFLSNGLQYAIGAVAFVLGAIPSVLAVTEFRRAKTSFDVRKPATTLVRGGPFRYSRNPGYVGLILAHVAIAFIVDSVWMMLMAIPAFVALHIGVVVREEQYLERTFGVAYREFKAAVPRWI